MNRAGRPLVITRPSPEQALKLIQGKERLELRSLQFGGAVKISPRPMVKR